MVLKGAYFIYLLFFLTEFELREAKTTNRSLALLKIKSFMLLKIIKFVSFFKICFCFEKDLMLRFKPKKCCY